jgi:hypothetical protein
VRTLNKMVWIAGAWLLTGCDQLADKYRVEFRDGSWREIAITPFADEARWREGCATGEVLSDMMLPLKRGKTVNGREQLLIGGELFELDDSALYRSNGMVFGHTPDHIQRGLKGLEVCRTLRPDRALPKLARGFGD